ncbi:MAG TPA: methionyl-tRNA formyltransferase, partial [Bacteroidales bacterium]|nr:methionyl-tRNA formyltransferase [Bacteroidales bacterium]
HAIMNGETVTGITTFFIEKEIDTGNVLFKEEVPITETDCAGTLHDKLMYKGSELILKTVQAIEQKAIKPIPQTKLIGIVPELKPAPKIFKDDCLINWNSTGKTIYNFIRGLSPYPAAYTKVLDKQGNERGLKIFETAFEPALHNLPSGQLITDHKKQIKVTVSDGYISLLSIQLEGKKRMDTKSFLNGMAIDTIISN